MEKDKIKLLRDFVIGDGSLFRRDSKSNGGCCLGIGHSDDQYAWIEWKKRMLEKTDIKFRFYQDTTPNRLGRRAWRIRSTMTQELRRLWESWYYIDENGRAEKDYMKLFNAATIDEDSLAILFLDNGSRGLKHKYKCYRTNTSCEIEPYIERFRLSVGRRKQDPVVLLLKSFGIESKKSREFTGEGEVLIGQSDSKQILKYILQEFCERNNLDDLFSYKYNFPVSMSQVKRLSEMAPMR